VKDLMDRALNVAQMASAQYADVRIVESRSQLIEVKDRKVTALQEDAAIGLGIRVLCDGAWGFAATARLSLAEVEDCARLACRVGRASARCRNAPVALAPVEPHSGRYQTPMVRDPFEVPLTDKIAILVEATGVMAQERAVRVAQGNMQFWEERKHFASSEGARIEQRIVNSGAGIAAWAAEGDDLQVRSYPNAFVGGTARSDGACRRNCGHRRGAAHRADLPRENRDGTARWLANELANPRIVWSPNRA
jgi:TldD protein